MPMFSDEGLVLMRGVLARESGSVVEGRSVVELAPIAEGGGGRRDCRRAEDRARGQRDDRFAYHGAWSDISS